MKRFDQVDADWVSPPRLVDGADLVSQVLRKGSTPPSADLPSGYRAIEGRLNRSARVRGAWSALAVAAAVLLAWTAWELGGAEELPRVEAELHQANLPAEPAPAEPTPAEIEETATEERKPAFTEKSEKNDASEVRPVIKRVSPSREPRASTSGRAQAPVVESEEDCGSLSATDSQAALACYGRATQKGGVAAELAYLEMARIQRRARGDGHAALRTLEEYQMQFPGGVLARDALLARTDLLVSLGMTARAVREIDRALEEERPTKLLIWRAQLAGRLGDCSTALALIDELERAGGRTESLLPIRQACR